MSHAASTPSAYTYRRLMLVAGVVYLLWWLLVVRLLPDAFNPLPGRVAVSASYLLFWALSFRLALVRVHLREIYAACSLGLTAHYYYLYAHNAADPNWLAGSYITVIALGITLEVPIVLFCYSAFVIAAAYYVSTLGSAVVSLPGTVTVLFLINVVGLVRRRADAERHRRERAEAEMAAAETVNRAKMLFLANVNHELRTPLAGILGFADLSSRAKLTSDEQLFVERIGANARTLLATVEQILALTSSEATPLKVKREPVDLQKLLQNSVDSVRQKSTDSGVGVSVSMIVPVPAAVSDEGLIGYVFGNLLDNALKFTLQGSVNVNARLMAGTEMVEILVVDTGVGIPKDQWDRVFDPFIQVQAGYDRAFGGSGVGLTVARRLARMLGGDVVIEASEPGKGTTMRFFFPLRAGAAT